MPLTNELYDCRQVELALRPARLIVADRDNAKAAIAGIAECSHQRHDANLALEHFVNKRYRDAMPIDGKTFNVPFPRQTERTVATLLRGYRFGPIKGGWMLLFENNETPPSEEHIDQLCVVMPPAGLLKARIVKRGRRPNSWDLLTATGDPELDQPLLWAERA